MGSAGKPSPSPTATATATAIATTTSLPFIIIAVIIVSSIPLVLVQVQACHPGFGDGLAQGKSGPEGRQGPFREVPLEQGCQGR